MKNIAHENLGLSSDNKNCSAFHIGSVLKQLGRDEHIVNGKLDKGRENSVVKYIELSGKNSEYSCWCS